MLAHSPPFSKLPSDKMCSQQEQRINWSWNLKTLTTKRQEVLKTQCIIKIIKKTQHFRPFNSSSVAMYMIHNKSRRMPNFYLTHQLFRKGSQLLSYNTQPVQQSCCSELWDIPYAGSKYFFNLSEKGHYNLPCSYNLEPNFTLLSSHVLTLFWPPCRYKHGTKRNPGLWMG